MKHPAIFNPPITPHHTLAFPLILSLTSVKDQPFPNIKNHQVIETQLATQHFCAAP